MELPNLTESDIRAAIREVSQVDSPIRGGQKLVFPCVISGTKYALKVILATSSAPDRDAEEYWGDESTVSDGRDDGLARVKREVELMDRCDSPYLVKMGPIPLRTQTIAGQTVAYFTEEWIQGRSLGEIIRQDGSLSPAEVVRLGEDIARAIEELWSFRVIHRDIKPGNIMRRDDTGDFVLLDMGIVYYLEDISLTAPGFFVGTPWYYSPEQFDLANKRALDFRSDLFVLGIVLYFASTGRHPFYRRGITSAQMVMSITGADPPPPSRHCPDIPPELDRVILRLLAKQPHLRYRSCNILRQALDSVSVA